MRWRDLIVDIPVIERGNENANPEVLNIVYDSRKVTPGSVYVAVKGFKDNGDRYIQDAIGAGAVVVVSSNPQPHLSVPWIQVAQPRRWLGELARRLWNLKLYHSTLVGITGTNGKTTVAHLFSRLLGLDREPARNWMFSTVGYSVEGTPHPATHTTPESSDIFRMLGQAPQKPDSLVMEVSSHALQLDRVAGFSYDCAIFTNLTQDHLDFHGTMQEYYCAKKRLFTDYLKARGCAVINIDDPWGRKLAAELDQARCITYGTAHGADVRIVNWECSAQGTQMFIVAGGNLHELHTSLVGFFNVYNVAALVAGARALSCDIGKVARVLESFRNVPGRMERVELEAPFSVLVDYAHTPDALENVLSTAEELTPGKVVCVFGCGGDRDKTKRPLMAAAVARHADEAVITSDNPRSEDPRAILGDIQEGIPLDFPHIIVPDRREAIYRALKLGRDGDTIVIAGKGHEEYQEIKGVRTPFSDREETVRAMQKIRQEMVAA